MTVKSADRATRHRFIEIHPSASATRDTDSCPAPPRIHRKTAETDIELELNLDGTGTGDDRHRRRLLRPHADAAGQARARSI